MFPLISDSLIPKQTTVLFTLNEIYIWRTYIIHCDSITEQVKNELLFDTVYIPYTDLPDC